MPKIKDLKKVYRDPSFSNSCIHMWFHWFSNGRKSLKEDPHSGQKVTVNRRKKVASIEEYVKKDRRITIQQLGEDLDTGYGTAQNILNNVLGMPQVCASWVPRLLFPE